MLPRTRVFHHAHITCGVCMKKREKPLAKHFTTFLLPMVATAAAAAAAASPRAKRHLNTANWARQRLETSITTVIKWAIACSLNSLLHIAGV